MAVASPVSGFLIGDACHVGVEVVGHVAFHVVSEDAIVVRRGIADIYFKSADGVYAIKEVIREQIYLRKDEMSRPMTFDSLTPKRIEYWRYSAQCLAAAWIDTIRANDSLTSYWKLHRTVRYIPNRSRPGAYSLAVRTEGSMYNQMYEDVNGVYSGPRGYCSRY